MHPLDPMGHGRGNEFYSRSDEKRLESFGGGRGREGQELIQSTVFLLGEGIRGPGVEEGGQQSRRLQPLRAVGPVWG